MVGLTGLMSNRYRLEDMPDLTGKVAIVTGGSAGIGRSIVGGLVQKGCEVHILSATPEHGQEAIEHLTSIDPKAKDLLHHHPIDLGSIPSLLSLARELASTLPRLDMLYNIAGVGVAPYGKTQDGLHNHFAINHLAPFLLTDVMLPKLKETAAKKAGKGDEEVYSTRIVSESSELHRAAGEIKLENTQLEEMNEDEDATRLYARSKLFGIYFIKELAKRHLPALTSTTPILAISVHPGAVSTGQQSGATEAYGTILGKSLEMAAAVGFMSPDQGAESALWAGTSHGAVERRNEVQGRYISEADGKVDTESELAMDDAKAKQLWDLSVQILKDKFDYQVKM
ncbi:hypothetical protein BCR39DRAFT_541596 [Naematelia encephala]|uniref:NAD(P)-binding protein n=1 Tax=Naematelia encephala TaxID=71784 RepID=A0A1Y2AUT8_9TREE|nr:hypothetical protein BCR39DRAFT_541596 [Naematelia encephala]